LRNNIRTTLNLDDFDAITTLGELRDFIPTVGINIKTYSLSRNERYLDPFSKEGPKGFSVIHPSP